MNTTFSFEKTLFAFFGFIGLLIAVRIFYTGSMLYLFLVWNIFLAWIPFMISSLFSKAYDKPAWIKGFIFCSWLAFFPNALYIVTDLIHLQIETVVPKWFDAVLLLSASVAGLMMAFISLYRVELFLYKTVHKKLHSLSVLFILFLASFGVYLGRFLRWNSWDIISNPFQLLFSIGRRIISPIDYLQTWTVTVTLTIFFLFVVYGCKKNARLY